MKIKKSIHRIFTIFLAVFFCAYSFLYAFCVPVYASSLPPDLSSLSNTELVENGFSVYTDWDSAFTKASNSQAVELGLMYWSGPEVYYNMVATEDLIIQMCQDFESEVGFHGVAYGLEQYNSYSLALLDRLPDSQSFIDTVASVYDADMVVLADEYVSVSDSFLERIGDFFNSHIKNNVYYSDIPEGNFDKITSMPSYPSVTYDYGYGTMINKNIVNPCFMLKDSSSFYLRSVDSNNNISAFSVYPANGGAGLGDAPLFFLISTNLPIFDNIPDFSKVDWWKDAENWFDINQDNTVSPITTPIGSSRGFVSALEWDRYYHDVSQNKKQQDKPKVDTTSDPQGYPVVTPTPVPDPVSTPIPQPIIDPVDIKPIVKPTPDPVDPDPDPVNPDPDPIIIPPDPVDPTPDPTQPDPDPDEPDDPDDDDEGDMIFDLSEFFPFCLPYDLYLAFHMLTIDDETEYFSYFGGDHHLDVEFDYSEIDNSDPDALVFDIPMTFDLAGLGQDQDVEYNFKIDIIHPVYEDDPGAEPYVKYLRFFLLFLYIIFLIFATIKIIPR